MFTYFLSQQNVLILQYLTFTPPPIICMDWLLVAWISETKLDDFYRSGLSDYGLHSCYIHDFSADISAGILQVFIELASVHGTSWKNHTIFFFKAPHHLLETNLMLRYNSFLVYILNGDFRER